MNNYKKQCSDIIRVRVYNTDVRQKSERKEEREKEKQGR